MKKITLILCLLLATFSGFSQEVKKLVTYKNCLGIWNKTKKEYDFEPYTYAKITFAATGDYITSDDNAHSVYRVINKLPDNTTNGSKVTSYNCTDEKNISCVFGIMQPFDCRNYSIGIIYDGYMLLYIIELQ